MQNLFIISLGGSVITPKLPDSFFLAEFRDLILRHAKEGLRFVIYCGGGGIAREYQGVARKLNAEDNDLDWIGIYATRLNASLLKSLFGNSANAEIIIVPTGEITFHKPILVAAGWKPGWSTDYVAVLSAIQLGADTIINITNVDYLYDYDPRICKDAVPIKKISWHEFRKMLPQEWSPGLSVPFDPIASKEAEKNKIRLIITGKDINNLDSLLGKKLFRGSIIE